MSYEPTVWKDGDLVTSAKLNKLEQGVANGGGNNIVMGVMDENNNLTLESTWQEIWDNNCTTVCFDFINNKTFCPIIQISNDNSYSVMITDPNGSVKHLYAKNADDYPTTAEGGGGEK